MSYLRHQIEYWLNSSEGWPKNRWFEDDTMRVYLRKYTFDNITRVDLANVGVECDRRGKGIYSKFLIWLCELAAEKGYGMIKVENVLERRFQQFHEKIGFKTDGREPPSYTKEL